MNSSATLKIQRKIISGSESKIHSKNCFAILVRMKKIYSKNTNIFTNLDSK